jgi:hypothetical protein
VKTEAQRPLLRPLIAACGVAGPLILVASFRLNPAPPPGLAGAALAAWATAHVGALAIGGWMQGIGSALIVIFALGLVELAGGAGFLGRLTGLAGAVILGVSLLEVAFYLAAAQAIAAHDISFGLVASGLIKATQHVFLIAPALLAPLGAAILTTRVLPRVFGWTGLAIGAVLQGLGLAGVLTPLQDVIDVVLIVQALWFVAAGVTLGVIGDRGATGAAATTTLLTGRAAP